MNKCIFILISIVLLVNCLFLEAVQMTIAYENREQPPYYMENSDQVLDKNPGIAVEIVMFMDQYIDSLDVSLIRLPWKRCKSYLETNEIDGIFNASYKPERLVLGWYPTVDSTHEGIADTTKRITTISYCLYSNIENKYSWDGVSYGSIKGIIGAPLGYSIVGDLRKYNVNVEEAISSEMNLNKLVKKRVDAVALQSITADNIIYKNPGYFNNVEKINPPLINKPYYLMLSHEFVNKHPAMSQLIWKIIGDIRKNEIEKIAKKY